MDCAGSSKLTGIHIPGGIANGMLSVLRAAGASRSSSSVAVKSRGLVSVMTDLLAGDWHACGNHQT
jgi:hypothetical protein